MPLPDSIIEVLVVFRPLFTTPTWRKLMTSLTGTLLAKGRRTVAAALRHRQQHGGQLEQLPSRAQPSAMVSPSSEPPTALAHCRNLRASRRLRGSGH